MYAKFEQEFEESDRQIYRYSHYPEWVGICLVNASGTAMHEGFNMIIALKILESLQP